MNMAVLAAALAATVLTAPKGKVYNDEPVVTNVTFEGLATTAEVEAKVAAATPADYAAVSDLAKSAVQPAELTPYAKKTEVVEPSDEPGFERTAKEAITALKANRATYAEEAEKANYAAMATIANSAAEASSVRWAGVKDKPDLAMKSDVSAATNGLLRAESDPEFTAWRTGSAIKAGKSASAGVLGIAIGGSAGAKGQSSVAVGNASKALDYHSAAFGYGAYASGSMATAVGRSAMATNDNAVAIGPNAASHGDGTVTVSAAGPSLFYLGSTNLQTFLDAAISSATGGLASVVSVSYVVSDIAAHTSRADNPHGVTAAQVGAYAKDEVDGKIAAVTNAVRETVRETGALFWDPELEVTWQGRFEGGYLYYVPITNVNVTGRD